MSSLLHRWWYRYHTTEVDKCNIIFSPYYIYIYIYSVGVCFRKNPEINGLVEAQRRAVARGGREIVEKKHLLRFVSSLQPFPPRLTTTTVYVCITASDPFTCKAYKLLIAIPQNRAILFCVRDFSYYHYYYYYCYCKHHYYIRTVHFSTKHTYFVIDIVLSFFESHK